MTINTEMFQRVYDQITQHPETHNQVVFEEATHCGTKRCVAGWAVAFEHGVGDRSIYDGLTEAWPPAHFAAHSRAYYMTETATEAARILGLTDEQACHLFYDVSDGEAVELCLRYATKGDEA